MRKRTLKFFDNRYYVTSEQSSKIQKKIVRIFIKKTLTDELKILDDKIKADQAQYDFAREAAKIPAWSSKDLFKK